MIAVAEITHIPTVGQEGTVNSESNSGLWTLPLRALPRTVEQLRAISNDVGPGYRRVRYGGVS
jgi:hypothetical protein